jgi:hypothetical protein
VSKRVDSNHSEIVKGLRAIGATVRSTASVGQGFPDLAVGFRNATYLLEVKDGAKSPSRRKLTEAEQAFHAGWKGHVAIVESLDDALRTIGATSPE